MTRIDWPNLFCSLSLIKELSTVPTSSATALRVVAAQQRNRLSARRSTWSCERRRRQLWSYGPSSGCSSTTGALWWSWRHLRGQRCRAVESCRRVAMNAASPEHDQGKCQRGAGRTWSCRLKCWRSGVEVAD